MKINYIDRITNEKKIEEVYGEKFLLFFYPKNKLAQKITSFLFSWIKKYPFVSQFYGYLQTTEGSKKKIEPFIKKYNVDTTEFEKKVEGFTSFNDFFIRKLKGHARPIDSNDAVLPADGRYLAFENIKECPYFSVKGKDYCLETFLQSKKLAKEFENGTLVLARLCPVDYHRFHFPIDCVPSKATLINGSLFSVSPIALKRRMGILCENKRFVTHLQSEKFGKVLFIEIGATNVGSVYQTYSPDKDYKKGDEKGYFSFGGSAIAMVFKEGAISLDRDLIQNTKDNIETLGQMGMSLGVSN